MPESGNPFPEIETFPLFEEVELTHGICELCGELTEDVTERVCANCWDSDD